MKSAYSAAWVAVVAFAIVMTAGVVVGKNRAPKVVEEAAPAVMSASMVGTYIVVSKIIDKDMSVRYEVTACKDESQNRSCETADLIPHE